MKKLITAAAILLITATSSFAQSSSTYGGRHHVSQQQRIHNGVRDGSLTRHEAVRLRAQQQGLRAGRRMAMADGRINPAERRMMNHNRMRANRSIYAARHNNDRRCAMVRNRSMR